MTSPSRRGRGVIGVRSSFNVDGSTEGGRAGRDSGINMAGVGIRGNS